MPRPPQPPIGLSLARTSKAIDRAFDAVLAERGSSRPVWLILMSLKSSKPTNQIELADAVGTREATLSHHLNAMETAGLIVRTRSPENRRVHQVTLTDAGNAAFLALVGAARAFDVALRVGIDEDQIEELRKLLDHLKRNVEASASSSPP